MLNGMSDWFGKLAIATLNTPVSIRDMFARISYNLDFSSRCSELKDLEFKPLISFVIPTKNEAEYLPRLLLSINYIANICRVPVEIIVADYMSADGTPEIAKRYGAKVIEVNKPGVGYASYIGVLMAKGDIIIRTDADTIITPSAMFEVLKVFNIDAKKLVATVGHIYYPLELSTNIIAYLYDRYVRKPYNSTGYFIALKSEVKEVLNFNPHLKVHEDYDFGKRALKLFGLSRLYYSWFNAVLTSSRLIRSKGYAQYIMEKLGLFKSKYVTYTQTKYRLLDKNSV